MLQKRKKRYAFVFLLSSQFFLMLLGPLMLFASDDEESVNAEDLSEEDDDESASSDTDKSTKKPSSYQQLTKTSPPGPKIDLNEIFQNIYQLTSLMQSVEQSIIQTYTAFTDPYAQVDFLTYALQNLSQMIYMLQDAKQNLMMMPWVMRAQQFFSTCVNEPHCQKMTYVMSKIDLLDLQSDLLIFNAIHMKDKAIAKVMGMPNGAALVAQIPQIMMRNPYQSGVGGMFGGLFGAAGYPSTNAMGMGGVGMSMGGMGMGSGLMGAGMGGGGSGMGGMLNSAMNAFSSFAKQSGPVAPATSALPVSPQTIAVAGVGAGAGLLGAGFLASKVLSGSKLQQPTPATQNATTNKDASLKPPASMTVSSPPQSPLATTPSNETTSETGQTQASNTPADSTNTNNPASSTTTAVANSGLSNLLSWGRKKAMPTTAQDPSSSNPTPSGDETQSLPMSSSSLMGMASSFGSSSKTKGQQKSKAKK